MNRTVRSEHLDRLIAQASERLLPALAAFARRTVTALPDGPPREVGIGYRDFVIDAQGKRIWRWPRSNVGERISVFRWLAQVLKDSAYEQMARRYADGMIDDPERGVYQGEEADGVGMLWYWRDCGLYMTNYTMRLPRPLLALSEKHDDKYARTARLCGRQLLHSQRDTGILRDGWYPRNPKPHLRCPPDLLKRCLRDTVINSRVGYTVSAYACLWRHTADSSYRAALDRMVDGMARYQNPDGSIPADIHSDRIEVANPAKKGHFMYYILNGFAEALTDMPDHAGLCDIATRLADFICGRFELCGACLYGDVIDRLGFEQEPQVWYTASADPAYGLATLARLTGNDRYLDTARRLVLQGISRILTAEDPDTCGAFSLYPYQDELKPADRFTVRIDGHFHFNLLCGLQAVSTG